MVRTIYPQVGGHGLVKGGRGVTGIWVAVVRAAVDKARVAHFRPALWRVHGQCARCSSGVEKRSWSPQSRAACTRGNAQVRRASPSHQSSRRGMVHEVQEAEGTHL